MEEWEKGLSISIVLHVALGAFLYFYSQSSPPASRNTSTGMVSLLNTTQKAQKQRIKGTKKTQPKKPKETEDSDYPNEAKRSDTLGNDKENAPEIEGGSPNPQLLAVASYAQDLKDFIERNRFYPRRAMVLEQTGTVTVRLNINAEGAFTGVEIIKASAHEALNRAARDLITELGSFKPLPKAYQGNGEFIVPIQYQLGRGR